MIALMLFWLLVGVIVYTYLLFPLLVLLRGKLGRQRVHSSEHTPTVSLIIAAYNEAQVIGAKLENVLALDYPRDRFEVLVASDGSTDDTAVMVAGYAPYGVRLFALPRQGKAGALNTLAAAATGEILVFSDANSLYDPGAIRALVRPFADPQVGGVAGNQRYQKLPQAASLTGVGETAYWGFDRWLKQAQSAAGNAISATGAIYAIRRSLFRPVAVGVTDDFYISTGVIAQGFRLLFAPDAIAYEAVADAKGMEFARKVRVITRGLRGVWLRRELLNPVRFGFYSLQLFSHKVLRRLVVWPLLGLLAVSPLLWKRGWFYRGVLLGQLALYGCGVMGWLLGQRSIGRKKLLALPFYFCLVNAAALLATWNLVRGYRIDRWEPQRKAEASPTALRPSDPPASRRSESAL